MNLNYQEQLYIELIEDKLNIKINKIKRINKGTLSKVFLLNNKYILKLADEMLIKRETIFFKKNHFPLLEKLVFCDDKNRFLVFKFISGENLSIITKENVEEYIKQIVEIAKNYKKTYRKKYGYIYENYDTWYDFLKSEIDFNKSFLPEEFNKKEENYVKRALENIKNIKIDSRYIHGDLGLHNIIFKNNKIKGIIDPTTVVGDYRYDIVYFVLSSYTISQHTNFEVLIKDLGEDVKYLLLILLYSRIEKTYKYNSTQEEIDFYKKIWQDLKMGV